MGEKKGGVCLFLFSSSLSQVKPIQAYAYLFRQSPSTQSQGLRVPMHVSSKQTHQLALATLPRLVAHTHKQSATPLQQARPVRFKGRATF